MMSSNNEVVYVRTASTYGDNHSAKYIELNKIYKAMRRESGAYSIIGRYQGKDEELYIRLEKCIWLNYNDWEIVEPIELEGIA